MLADLDVVKEQHGNIQAITAGQCGVGIDVDDFQGWQRGDLRQACQFGVEFIA